MRQIGWWLLGSFGSESPHAHFAIVRPGDDRLIRQQDRSAVDARSVSHPNEGLTVNAIKHSHCSLVPDHGVQVLARVAVPDLDRAIMTARDDPEFVDVDAPDAFEVSKLLPDTLRLLDVPDADRIVERSRNHHRLLVVRELEVVLARSAGRLTCAGDAADKI